MRNVGHGKRLITVLSNVGHGKFLSFETILLNTFDKIFLLEPWTLLHHFEYIYNQWYLLTVIKKQQNAVQIYPTHPPAQLEYDVNKLMQY